MLTYEEAKSFAKYYKSTCISELEVKDVNVVLDDWLILNNKKKIDYIDPSTPFKDVHPSVRLSNIMMAHGLYKATLMEISHIHMMDLLKLRNFGKRSLNELNSILNSAGLNMKGYDR